jgi:prepilin-type N-terminal cleavage/methylation domain-containing protein
MFPTRHPRHAETGFTIVEILTVLAIIAVLSAVAAPFMLRFKAAEDVKPAIVEIGGKLRTARSQALTEGLPQLVFIQKETIVDGKRTVFAQFVRDNDRSYSITPPDDVEEFELGGFPLHVRQYGDDDTLLPNVTSGGSGSALDGDYISLLGDYSQKMADGQSTGDYSDVMAMYEDKAEDWASSGNPGCSGAGPCLDPGHGDYEPQFDPASPGYDPAAVLALLNGTYNPGNATELTNGTTFPIANAAGVPAIGFTERGIPVDLDTPKAWGTGAGSVFVTDGSSVVYAASVTPLGTVSERRFDTGSNTWK